MKQTNFERAERSGVGESKRERECAFNRPPGSTAKAIVLIRIEYSVYLSLRIRLLLLLLLFTLASSIPFFHFFFLFNFVLSPFANSEYTRYATLYIHRRREKKKYFHWSWVNKESSQINRRKWATKFNAWKPAITTTITTGATASPTTVTKKAFSVQRANQRKKNEVTEEEEANKN